MFIFSNCSTGLTLLIICDIFAKSRYAGEGTVLCFIFPPKKLAEKFSLRQ